MIHAVRCDQPEFHDIEFGPDFNVVLATRTKGASDKDSRNGAGKTTLIEIIHFCLGSSGNRRNRLMVPQLRGWTFTIELDLRGKKYTVSRNTANPRRIILEGDFDTWPLKPKKDSKTGELFLTIPQWSDALGWLMFNMPTAGDESFEPTFRSLVSYFVRRGRDAFSTPFEHFRKQKEWDKQVNNAFLLGLSWEYPSRLQKLKEREKTVGQLRSAIKAGTFPELIGTVGELESQKVRLEEIVARRGEQLRTFRVHPQYSEYQDRANSLQSQIRRLNLENATDQAMLSFYEESLVQENPPETDKLAQIYLEAGVAWPEAVQKRLEDVQSFHTKVVTNRRAFLEMELSRLARAVAQRTAELQERSDERADVLSILSAYGALAEYAEMQRLQTEDIGKLIEANQRIASLKKIDEIRSQTRIEREQLQVLARDLYEKRRADREKAILLFNSFSQALYNRAGELVVDVVDSGYSFRVDIERRDSQGVEQMKVFLYDLTLATLWAEKHSGPGFLVHDSTIFADVDERQKAHALELAAKTAKTYGFQYICCLNSDAIPSRDFSEGFSLQPYVRVELTDEGPNGGLLGIRY